MKLLTLTEGSATDFVTDVTDVISFPGASVLFKLLTVNSQPFDEVHPALRLRLS